MRRFVCLVVSFSLLCLIVFVDSSIGQEVPLIKPPALGGADKELKLPGTVDDVVVGGNGRYILYLFGSLRKVGVFDVNEAKLTHYISVPDDNCKIAAGMTKVLVASGDGSTISRYDLASGERELTKPLAISGPPEHLLLGSATEGPAILSGSSDRKPPLVIDLKSLDTSAMSTVGNQGFRRPPRRISANGKTLTCWAVGVSPSGLQTIVQDGDKWKSRYDHTSVGAILPAANGRRIFTSQGVHSDQLQMVGTPKEAGLLVPAVHGSFYLGVPHKDQRRSKSKPVPQKLISVFMLGDVRPLATIPNDTPGFEYDGGRYGREALTGEKKIVFVPRANLLVRLSTSKDRLLLTSFDVEKSLSKSDVDFLFVESQPVDKIKAGDAFKYQIKALAKSSEIKYSLASAPEGMSVSKSGLVTWATSEKSTPNNSVVVSIIAESGQEIFHTFSLNVDGASGSGGGATAKVEFKVADEISIEPSPVSGVEKERTVKLPESINNLVVGGGGRFVLLHFKNLRKIGLFDVSVAKITKYFPAPSDNIVLAAGANHVLIIDQDQGVMSRYNLSTFERELTKPVPFAGKITGAGMGDNSYGPVMVRWSGTTGSIDRASLGLIDLKTLGESKIAWPVNDHLHIVNRDQTSIAASSDGKFFSVSRIGIFRISGTQLERMGGRSFNEAHKIPAANGRYFVSAGTIYNDKMVAISGKRNSSTPIVPAISGQYYLKFESGSRSSRSSRSAPAPKVSATLHFFGDERTLATISDLPAVPFGSMPKNAMLIPEAKLIICVPTTSDSLVLKYLDIETVLKDSGIDYLIATSRAPETAEIDQTFKYQIKVLSNSEGLKYSLASAPQGMSVSDSGLVTWATSKGSTPENSIIVSVSSPSGKEIFHTFSLRVVGATGVGAASVSSTKFSTDDDVSIKSTPLSAADNERTVKLPETINDLVVGGGGRFLLIHFKSLRKVGLFDLSAGKITKYFPATGDNILLAAGANHLVMIDQDQGVMSRYNLTTHDRELTKPVPFPGKVTIASMGSNSYGPVIVRWSGASGAIDRASLGLIDLETLDESDVTWPKNGGYHMVNRDQTSIAVSDDGKIFSASEAGVWRLAGDQIERIPGQSFHDRSQKIPAVNGSYFVSRGAVFNDKLVSVTGDRNSAAMLFPAINGHYFIGLEGMSSYSGSRDTRISKYSGKLYLFGDSRPIMTVKDLPLSTIPANRSAKLGITGNLMLIPKGKLIACVPPSLDSIYLRYFDIETSLKESGIDYLIVTSTAPKNAELGERYEYQLDTLSKKGKVKYKLDSAPKGMTISSKGKIVWQVQKSLESATEKVIVTVSDAAGQETFHSFSIDIPEVVEIAAAKKQETFERAEQKKRVQKQALIEQKIKEMELMAKRRREEAVAQLSGPSKKGQDGETPQVSRPKQKIVYAIEKWTDATGAHDMEAKFVEIVDRSSVVLQAKDGTKRTVPLHRLIGKHIYRAVEYDVKSRSVTTRPRQRSGSPFAAGASSVSAETVSEKDLREIIARVEEMIGICKNEKDPEAFLEQIISPTELSELKAKGRLGRFKERFEQAGTAQEILMSLLGIDFSKGKVGKDGVVQFQRIGSGRTMRFKKEGSSWGLLN